MSLPSVSPAATAAKSEAQPSLVRGLSLLDSVLLLVGGIIGSSIFLTAKDIAGPLPRPLLFLLVWILGGLISLCACFAFAELGSMFPDSGGQYVYLREAYGDLPAFLYGWMLFSVANGGTIAALSVASAAYLGGIVPAISEEHIAFSAAGIVLTRAHIVALLSIVVVTFGVALIAVFWAYDGWVYITWVSGEVKNPRRNVPLAMVLGVIAVGIIYMAMNMTYVYAMPLSEITQHETIAHAAATALFSPGAAVWLSALIALSCFGAMASVTLSGARVYYAMALDGAFFQKMAQVHPKWRTPAFSLIGQGVWGAILTVSGRYDQLYTYVMFGMVLSYTMTVIGMFILRWKQPDTARPYRCTGYPWLPAIYVLIGGAWTLNTIVTRPMESLAGTMIVLIGVPGYLYWKRRSGKLAA